MSVWEEKIPRYWNHGKPFWKKKRLRTGVTYLEEVGSAIFGLWCITVAIVIFFMIILELLTLAAFIKGVLIWQ